MTENEAWVELWLDRFCEPGTHTFIPLTSALLWCAECGKKELAEGSTCLFCDIPSSSTVMLQRPGNEERTVSHLCVLCFEDLESKHEVRGWRLAAWDASSLAGA